MIRRVLTSTTLAGAAIVVLATPSGAAPACSVVEQVTVTTGSSGMADPVIDADGDRIAVVSTRDLGGTNADLNQEVFLADLTADTFTNLTDTIGSAPGNSQPAISDDGTRIAFVSAADLAGTNGDEIDQVFLYDTQTETVTQRSVDATGEGHDPAISGDGTDIAYRADANPTGLNVDGNDEIFVVPATGVATPTQVTVTTTGDAEAPSMNQTGSRVAFAADSNPVVSPGNADGNTEVYVADPAGPTVVQVTNTTVVGNDVPEIDDAGNLVTFASQADLTGANADNSFEIFRRHVSTAATLQLTGVVAGGNQGASVNGTAGRVAFVSSSVDHPTNTNSSTDVYVGDVGQSGVTAVTDSAAGRFGFAPSISDDGGWIALLSNEDPLGTNGDHNSELFLARCGSATPTFSDVSTGNAFFGQIQWMEELGIASGFPGGLFKPQDPVKRQQMAGFLYNLAGQPAFTPPGTPTFVDVPASNPFFLQVEWMVAEGIASGFPGGLFKPQDPVKRQQMAGFLYNLAGEPLFVPPGAPTFVDVPPGNPFAVQIEWMSAERVASGFPGGLFKPQDAVKRQQMANFMHNFTVGVGVDLS